MTLLSKQKTWSFLLLAAASAAAQTAAPSAPVLNVKTQLVALDISASAPDGHPVLDLTAHDFTITENGVPQAIVAFESPTQHRLPPSAEVHSSADLKKLGSAPVTILVLDEMNGLFDENSYARYSLQRFLKESPSLLEQPTLLMVESNKSFEVLVDFTRDRDALLHALDHHTPDLPTRRMQGGANGDAAMERVLFTVNAIEQTAQAYAGYPGRKNILWIGNALPSVSTQEMPADDLTRVETTVQRCLNLLVSAHTALYTIDPRANSSAQSDLSAAIESGADSSFLADPSTTDPLADGQNFGMIAAASGGASISGRNAIDKVLQESLTSGTNYYTLFYKPTSPSQLPNQYRKIAVRVSRPHLTLASRLGYYANTSPETHASAESMKTTDARALLSFDLSSAATNGLSYTALALEATHLSSPDRLRLQTETVGLSWSPPDSQGQQVADVVVLVAALDSRKHIGAHHVYHAAAKLQPSTEKARRVILELPLAPDLHGANLRIIVRDSLSGRMGSTELTIAHQK